jgi:Mg2+/Co2+ transporter CorB
LDYHSGCVTTLGFTLIAANPQSAVFLVVLLLLLLVLSFIASGAEVALFSLQSRDVNVLKTKQHASARRIISLLEERKAVYTSLLIASTFFNISIIILSNFLLSPILQFGFVHFIVPIDLDFLIKVVLIAS